MRVIINGGTPSRQKLIRAMAQWFGKNHLSKLNTSITILVHLYRIKNDLGRTSVADNITKRPKYFEVEIDTKQKRKEFRRTFMHELWHIRQFATDVLYDYQTQNAVRFKGSIYLYDKEDSKDKAIYLNTEWEIEARGIEDALLYGFWKYRQEQRKKKK